VSLPSPEPQQSKRRMDHRAEVPIQRVQQAHELLPLVEPKTNLRPLLMLEALVQLGDEGVKDHRFTTKTPTKKG